MKANRPYGHEVGHGFYCVHFIFLFFFFFFSFVFFCLFCEFISIGVNIIDGSVATRVRLLSCHADNDHLRFRTSQLINQWFNSESGGGEGSEPAQPPRQSDQHFINQLTIGWWLHVRPSGKYRWRKSMIEFNWALRGCRDAYVTLPREKLRRFILALVWLKSSSIM